MFSWRQGAWGRNPRRLHRRRGDGGRGGASGGGACWYPRRIFLPFPGQGLACPRRGCGALWPRWACLCGERRACGPGLGCPGGGGCLPLSVPHRREGRGAFPPGRRAWGGACCGGGPAAFPSRAPNRLPARARPSGRCGPCRRPDGGGTCRPRVCRRWPRPLLRSRSGRRPGPPAPGGPDPPEIRRTCGASPVPAWAARRSPQAACPCRCGRRGSRCCDRSSAYPAHCPGGPGLFRAGCSR